MGLDAVVYCDCYEKGLVRRPPPQPELVYVDSNGQVCLKWDAPGADQNAFYDWLKNACDHGPMGELVWHRLGNVARIGLLRSLLSDSVEQFPVLLTRVVYDGTHAGDSLSVGDVQHLLPEVGRLRGIHAPDRIGEEIIREFERQVIELVLRPLRKVLVVTKVSPCVLATEPPIDFGASLVHGGVPGTCFLLEASQRWQSSCS